MGYNNVGGSYDCGNVGGVGDYKNNSKEFVLIVVLFILLIIVGAHFMKNGY
ncbi:YjcZ family sporulation protein [Lysinibacillus yapensis]|uniref:YjcZ family sporulation protein n=2 Tax=Ureibacillus yapensis TaxID=2304605 RepID=A0A396SJE2_9BACL|nr:YjcZ family sporulation protein [Lysinibacillus yapensis]RHW33957.1 YjcZ family sporulation protein [Lysinibacillus yapensis]